jgi:hypothetical protein
VNVRAVLEAMMDRLSAFASDGGSQAATTAAAFAAVGAFEHFDGCIAKLLSERTAALETAEVLRLHKALLNFALKCYPANLDYVNHCLAQVRPVGFFTAHGFARVE